MRSTPEFWIVNSEVFLSIKYETEVDFKPDNLKNLDLIAVFNYITKNSFKNENIEIDNGVQVKVTDEELAELKVLQDGDLKDLYCLINRTNSLPYSDGDNILIFEIHFIPLMFQFFQVKYEEFFNEINEQYSNIT